MKRFGTAGIRGIIGSEITNELAIALGGAFSDSRVLVATDTRPSGPMLKMALVSGLLAHDNDVIDLGVATTPTLCNATRAMQLPGIGITASHNPEEYNGFKFFSNGMEIGESEQQRIERMLNVGYELRVPGSGLRELKGLGETERVRSTSPLRFPQLETRRAQQCESYRATARFKDPRPETRKMSWEKVGSLRQETGAIGQHIERILEKIPHEKLAKRNAANDGVAVIADCNGSASVITPRLLREAGAKVVSLNCEGGFSRPSEPTEEALASTLKLARGLGAIAIAHDGDADRCVAMDETGEYIGLDRQLAMVADYLLQNSGRNKTVISTVESGLALREAVEKNGGKLTITKVGSGNLGRLAKQKNALFGGEPCGEYVFPELHHGADGIAAALLLAEMHADEKLSVRKRRYMVYPVKRGKFALGNASRSKLEIMENVRNELPKDGELNETDGIRVDSGDSFALVRPSGTENVIRLTCEARNEKELTVIYSKFSKLIEKVISR